MTCSGDFKTATFFVFLLSTGENVLASIVITSTCIDDSTLLLSGDI